MGRKILFGIKAAIVANLLLAGSAQAQQKEITVMMWGTAWQAVFKDLSEGFTRETGIKVNVETQTSAGEGLVKLQAMRNKPTVDVWFTTLSVGSRGAGDTGLFADIPAEKMDNIGKTIPGSATKKWVSFATFPMLMIYRTDMIKNPPAKWEDLWNAEYKNKLALPNMAMYQARLLLLAATLGGGDERNVDPGFEKLKSLKPNVAMFYASDAQFRQALAQGEVAAAFAPPAQLRWLISNGAPVKAAALHPAPLEFDVAMLVKSGKEDLGAAYVNYLIRKDVNEAMAAKRNMGPTNIEAAIPASLTELMPPPGKGLLFDESIVNANIPAWTERFNREVAN